MLFTQPRLTFSRIPTTALAYGTLNQRLFPRRQPPPPLREQQHPFVHPMGTPLSKGGASIPIPTPISTPNRRRLPDPAIHAKGDLGRAATVVLCVCGRRVWEIYRISQRSDQFDAQDCVNAACTVNSEKDLQGFCLSNKDIPSASQNGRETQLALTMDENLVNIFFELTVSWGRKCKQQHHQTWSIYFSR